MKTMNKPASRKLTLNRETLAPLQSDQLADVNGGVTPIIPAVVGGSILVSAVAGSIASYFACRP